MTWDYNNNMAYYMFSTGQDTPIQVTSGAETSAGSNSIFAADNPIKNSPTNSFQSDGNIDGGQALSLGNSIFDLLDKNKDGILSDDEVYSYQSLETGSRTKIESELNNIFKNLDTDGDGVVGQEEASGLDAAAPSGGLSGDVLKKLMIMAGLNLDENVKKSLKEFIDGLTAQSQEPTAEEHSIEEALMQEADDAAANSYSPYNGDVSPQNSGGQTANPKTASEYEAEIAAKESEKQNLKTQTAEKIKEQEQLIQDILTQEGSGLPPEQLEAYNKQKAEIDSLIQEKQTTIDTQKVVIQEKTAARDAIDSSISAYEGQIENLKANKSSGDSSDSERQSRIDTKIANLEAAITAKKQEKERLQSEIDKAQEAIKTAQTDKDSLEEDKAGLLDKMLEENKNSIPQEILDKIETAKTEISDLKSEETSKTESLEGEIQTLKTDLAKLKEKEESNKLIDENKESSFDANGNRIGERKMPSTPEEYAKYGLDSDNKISRFEACNQTAKEELIDLLDYAMENGMSVKITSSLRTYQEQVKIYNGGANPLAAKPGSSMHESGKAFDIRIEGANRNNPNDPKYKKLGEFWMARGHRWGGVWRNQVEPWHFDTKNG